MCSRWLLLHGTPLDPQVWEHVRPHLPGDVAVPDLNRLIRTTGPAEPAQEPLQAQVAAAVLARLPKNENLLVVGHSFGGQVAIELALKAPHRMRRLIIVCSRHTPCPAFADGARAVRNSQRFDIEADLARWFTPEELARNPPVIAYLRSRLATAPRGPWAASLEAVATYDRSTAGTHIATPARLFAAAHDEVAAPAVMAQLADALPNAELKCNAAWALMSPFDDTGGFAAMLSEAAT